MTDGRQVAELEQGVVRVFALDGKLAADLDQSGTLDRLCSALGVSALDPNDVQIVPLNSIAELGLHDFLRQGYDITLAELAPFADTFDGLTGEVAILRSGAFGGQVQALSTKGEAQLVATLHEPNAQPPRPYDQQFSSSKGTLATPPQPRQVSDAAMSGRVAAVALLVMFAMLALMIWVAA